MTLWINGDWVTGEGDARTKTNPVGQEVLWSGNDASAGQVEQACQAARRAFPAWAKRPFSERQALVEKFAALLEANKAELTRIIACETSKPRGEGVPYPHRRAAYRDARRRRHAAPPSARGAGGVWPL